MFGCSHGSAPRGSPQSPYSSGPINNGYGMKLPVSSVQLVPLAPRTRIIILPMLCREHSPTLLQKWAQLPHVCVESVWGWGCTCHHLWCDSSHLSHSPAAEAEDFRDFNLRLQEGHGNISFYQSPIPRFHCVLNSLLLIQEGNPAWSLSPCKVLPMWKKPHQAHRLLTCSETWRNSSDNHGYSQGWVKGSNIFELSYHAPRRFPRHIWDHDPLFCYSKYFLLSPS